ncbi:MAG: YfhO family protein, partial [Faecalibacillus intestinalis]
VSYIVIATVVSIIAAVNFLYLWLRVRGVEEKIAFVAALFFLLAGPLLYHSHKQIMFVNYMPFLIMAFMGVDRYFEKQKPAFMIVSIFLMIMTSYFYSVGGILAVTIYGVYSYFEKMKSWSFQSFWKYGSVFAISIICAIFMGGILLLPSLAAIMNGRIESKIQVSLLQLFLPNFDLSFIVYHCYGVGVTALGILALLGGVVSKRKSDRILAISLLAIFFLPIFMFGLNGGLYVRGKVLIPFLPLVIRMIAIFLTDMKDEKINVPSFVILTTAIGFLFTFFFASKWRILFAIDMFGVIGCVYLAWITKRFKILYVPSLVIACIICLGINRSDTYEKQSQIAEIENIDKQTAINEVIDSDPSVYRFQDLTNPLKTINKVYNSRFFKTSIYTSTYNLDYLNLYATDFNNANPCSNKIATIDSNNILFLTYMGVKYIVTKDDIPIGYKVIAQEGDYKIIQNENVFPIGFANTNIMSKSEYDKLAMPYQPIALLQNIITEKEGAWKSIDGIQFEKIDLPLMKKDDKYFVKNPKDIYTNVPLEKSLGQDLLILKFHVKNNT